MSTNISKQDFENIFLGFDDEFLNTVGDEFSEDLILCENNRDWKIKYRNEEVIGLMANLRILLKSRNDQAMEFIPERLYSSLKYEMVHEMTSAEIPILLVKIQIINPTTEEEIMTTHDNGILLGNPEGVLTKVNGKHSLKSKVHFSDIPHQKRDYSMRVCYYLPSDLMKPVLVVQSPKFKIYTRRNPNDISSVTSTKRKREFQTEKGNAKKSKVDLKEYLNQLDELLQLKNNLSKDEQKEALDLAISKLQPQKHEINKENSLHESNRFEDLFTPKDCSTYEAITDNFDFDFNNELETCIF